MNIFTKLISRRKTAHTEAAVSSSRFSIVGTEATGLSRIWTVGGGKGGVGKSIVAANFGSLLANAGHRTLMIDADFGAANLHTLFGIAGSNPSFSSFLKEEVSDIRRLITETGVPNLEIITGAMDSLNMADLDASCLARLQKALSELDYDYVVMDLAPGTSSNILDCFLMSDEGILVTTPEPTAIENTYRFIKCLFLRRIKAIINSGQPGRLKEALKGAIDRDPKISTIADFIRSIRQDPEGGALPEEILGGMGANLVINRARLTQDRSIGPQMQRACRNYFGIHLNHLGDIGHDTAIEDSVRMKRPLVQEYPAAPCALALASCFQRLTSREHERLAQEAGTRTAERQV